MNIILNSRVLLRARACIIAQVLISLHLYIILQNVCPLFISKKINYYLRIVTFLVELGARIVLLEAVAVSKYMGVQDINVSYDT